MNFEEAIETYERVANELVTMRSKLRADEEERERREALLWFDIGTNPEYTNERQRKGAFEAKAVTDEEFQDLLGSIQIQRDAIARQEIEERVSRKWMDWLIAKVCSE